MGGRVTDHLLVSSIRNVRNVSIRLQKLRNVLLRLDRTITANKSLPISRRDILKRKKHTLFLNTNYLRVSLHRTKPHRTNQRRNKRTYCSPVILGNCRGSRSKTDAVLSDAESRAKRTDDITANYYRGLRWFIELTSSPDCFSNRR